MYQYTFLLSVTSYSNCCTPAQNKKDQSSCCTIMKYNIADWENFDRSATMSVQNKILFLWINTTVEGNYNTCQFSQHSTSKSAFGIRRCYNKVREPLLHSFVSRWKQCFNPWRGTFNRCRKVVTRLSSEHSCQGVLLPIQAQASEL